MACRPNLGCHLLVTSWELKMALTFFSSWKISKEEEYFTTCEGLHEIITSVSINNILWNPDVHVPLCVVVVARVFTVAQLSKLGQRLSMALSSLLHSATQELWLTLTQLELDSVSSALCITLSVTFLFSLPVHTHHVKTSRVDFKCLQGTMERALFWSNEMAKPCAYYTMTLWLCWHYQSKY